MKTILSLLILLGSCFGLCEAQTPRLVLNADIGSVDLGHGEAISVSTYGVYGPKSGLYPHVKIEHSFLNRCANGSFKSSCNGSKYLIRSYSVAEIKDLLRQMAVSSLDEEMKPKITLQKEEVLSLTNDQAQSLKKMLADAVGIIDYLKPKFDAFNSVPPDATAPDVLGDKLINNSRSDE